MLITHVRLTHFHFLDKKNLILIKYDRDHELNSYDVF